MYLVGWLCCLLPEFENESLSQLLYSFPNIVVRYRNMTNGCYFQKEQWSISWDFS